MSFKQFTLRENVEILLDVIEGSIEKSSGRRLFGLLGPDAYTSGELEALRTTRDYLKSILEIHND